MNIIDLYVKSYAVLSKRGSFPQWLLSPLRFAERSLANIILPKYLSKSIDNSSKTIVKDLIISFTSFPARIKEIWQVVECLKRQTILPEKIILYLSEEQFPRIIAIPESLRSRQDNLFEIRIVSGDIRSHKKYYYAMQEFPDKTIVTCDDDVYYGSWFLQELVRYSKKAPGCIVANDAVRIKHNEQGELLPYLQFGQNVLADDSDNLVQIGVGGVLYPPHSLNTLVLDREGFTKAAPMADDLWLCAMARLNGTPVIKTCSYKQTLPPIITNSSSLTDLNNGEENLNDRQFKTIREYLFSKGKPDVFSSSFNVSFGGVSFDKNLI